MTMDRDKTTKVAILCATFLLAGALGGCAQKTAPESTTSSAAPAEADAHSFDAYSIDEIVASGKVETFTVEAAVAALPGTKLPSGSLVADPKYAFVNDAGGQGVVEVVIYYASDVMIVATPASNDLEALSTECDKANRTNPFVDGKKHDAIRSTQLGKVLAIEGGWQKGAPKVTPSRAIFNLDGVGYVIESTSEEPIPVGQLVALAQTMRRSPANN